MGKKSFWRKIYKLITSHKIYSIIVLIGLLASIYSFFPSDSMKFNNQGATFESNVIQGDLKDSNISISEINNFPDSPVSGIHTREFLVSHTSKLNGRPVDEINVAVILKDNQIAYVPELPYDTLKVIAYSNSDETDFYIVHAYRNKIDNLCSIMNSITNERYGSTSERCVKFA